ncbi:MAG: OmpA family protein [Alphaproteobacteria bacterium]|nr:OmpA family protein [Alphaproteobacteria bacterium]
MAARPVPHLLAAFSLAFGLGVMAAPARAQNYIGSGNVQVNIQVLDQLGGTGASAAGATATPQLPLIGSTGRAPKQAAAPMAAPLSGPQPLLGETGQPAAAIKLRRPGSSTATRKASVSAAKAPAKTSAAPAAVPAATPAAPAVAAAPAPTVSTPAAPTTPPAPAAAPQAGTPTPVVPAPSAPPAAAAPAPAPAVPAAAPAQAPAPSVAAAPPTAPAASTPAASAPAPAPTQAPVPSPAPQAAAPAPAPQVAAAPTPPRPVPAPGPASGPGGLVTLAFAGGQGELPSSGLAALDALATQYANGEDRLQIRAYAASTVSDGGSGARRLSLTRALAVRQYLIDKGIRSTRIDVRALGAPTDGSTADRVEVAPVGR